MTAFTPINGELCAEQVPLSAIADAYGTPCYVYSKAVIRANFEAYEEALSDAPHLVCYAVKANSNLAVLQLLAGMGAGFDIVSGGELQRVLAAGGSPDKIIFPGVGKREDEMRSALEAGILCFNVESEPELLRLDRVAGKLGRRARVSLRVNPDVDARTHPYISTGLKENKFGVDSREALDIYRRASGLENLEVAGIDCHIGSQLTDLSPYLDALDRLLAIVDTLQDEGIAIGHLDLGGGLGVAYQDEAPPSPAELVAAVQQRLAERELTLMLEPGRSIIADAGVLLMRVEYLKYTPHKNFLVVDGAMNDLLRPALYGAWQDIVEVDRNADVDARTWDVVGPVCESADFIGKDRELAVREGDLLAVRHAGAYGFVMSSNYNTRPRAAEVMVDGNRHMLVRQRETMDDLLGLERLLTDEQA